MLEFINELNSRFLTLWNSKKSPEEFQNFNGRNKVEILSCKIEFCDRTVSYCHHHHIYSPTYSVSHTCTQEVAKQPLSWRGFSSLVISVIYEEKNQIKPNKLELKISLTHKNQRNKPTNQISRLLKDIRRDVMGPNGYLLRLLLDRTCVKSLPLLVSFLYTFSFKFFVPLPRYLYTCKVYIINKSFVTKKKK